ncbi:portal protein, partial [Cronobacter malonaticus]|uniref:portal protein n=1 Tax=Cronobacter malonaticus TaxID=413503 RepID=UPI002DB6B74D
QTGQMVALNDLSTGRYDVTVDVGPSYTARRDATIGTLSQILQNMLPTDPMRPAIMGIIIDNMDGEGLDDFKEYNRSQLLTSGVVKPRNQKEQAVVQQAQQAAQSQPSADIIAAMAQDKLANAELQKAANEQADIQVKAYKAQTDAQVAAAKVVEILASADSQKKKDIREALQLLSQFQQQQDDNARADAELVLKGQAQGHAQRMDINSILNSSPQSPADSMPS